EEKRRAEGAATGDHDIYCCAVFHSDDYAAGDADSAGGAQRRIGGGDFSPRASLLGEPARRDATRRAGAIEGQRAADDVSAAGQRVSRGDGGRERGARDDDSQSALLGSFTLAAWRTGGFGVAACGGGAGRRDRD